MKRKIFLFLTIFSMAVMMIISGCNKEKIHTVTFDANGGSGIMETQSFVKDVPQMLSFNTFTHDGNAFIGWNTISDGTGVSYYNGEEITIHRNITLYAQWGQLNGHAYIDLGLPSGTKWATCNVGSNSPEGYGDYFAWGECYGNKQSYYWSTYGFCNSGSIENYGVLLTKYCTSPSSGYAYNASGFPSGFTDSLTTLQACDDAATTNWGTGWHMPTQTEMQELLDNSIVEWTLMNGVKGSLITGPNGNSIFLPAAGNGDINGIRNVGKYASYWSSSLGKYGSTSGCKLMIDSVHSKVCESLRYCGYSVRPVCW